MLQAFKSWINAEGSSVNSGANLEFEAPLHLKELEAQEPDETPSHPPQHRGIPSKSLRRVMRSQLGLIKKIRTSMPFSNEDFDRLVLPVITEFVSFVHLLPGSEAHHHSTPGGLVRHGLEAGLWAVRKTGEVIFATNGSPLERKTEEPKWILATFIGALMHDVGKPAVDLAVFIQEGDQWNPHDMHLTDWLREKNAEQYYLKWEEGRVGRHEKISAAMALKLLPDETRVYLSDPNKDILHEMMTAISGKNFDSIMNKLVIEADQESVSSDLKKNPNVQDHYAAAVPVHAYVNEAISILINRKKWTANEGKCPVWVIDGTVYIWWSMFFEDILDVIKERNIPGVPPNPDTVANILIERGLAVPNTFHEGGSEVYYRYWKVIPNSEEKGVALNSEVLMLRIDDPEDIFTDGVPANGPATLVIHEDPSGQETENDIKSDATDKADGKSVSEPAQDNSGKDVDPKEKSNKSETKSPAANGAIGGGLASLLAGVTAPKPEKANDKPEGEKKELEPGKSEPTISKSPHADSDADSFEGLAALAAQKQKKPVSDGGLLDMFGASEIEPEEVSTDKEKAEKGTEESKSNPTTKGTNKSPADKSGERQKSIEPPKSNSESIFIYLNKHGDSGKLISEEVKKIESGESTLGSVICRDGKTIYIHHPEGTQKLGDPSEVIKMFKSDNCLVCDPVMKSKVVQDISGIKGLVLIEDISLKISSYFSELEEGLSNASGSITKADLEELDEIKEHKNEKKTKPKDKSSDKPKQGSVKKKRPAKVEKTEPKKKIVIPKDDVIDSKPTEADSKADNSWCDDSVTPKEVIKRFVGQVIAGKGPWLCDPKGVMTHKEGWEGHCYGRLSLECMSADTGITVALLRKQIARSRRNTIKMDIKDGLVWVSTGSIDDYKKRHGIS